MNYMILKKTPIVKPLVSGSTKISYVAVYSIRV